MINVLIGTLYVDRHKPSIFTITDSVRKGHWVRDILLVIRGHDGCKIKVFG